jgi:hypothetical protein
LSLPELALPACLHWTGAQADRFLLVIGHLFGDGVAAVDEDLGERHLEQGSDAPLDL